MNHIGLGIVTRRRPFDPVMTILITNVANGRLLMLSVVLCEKSQKLAFRGRWDQLGPSFTTRRLPFVPVMIYLIPNITNGAL